MNFLFCSKIICIALNLSGNSCKVELMNLIQLSDLDPYEIIQLPNNINLKIRIT
ncbi:putative signal peptide protein [Puccinia sorghi]|uniref:Putative signal peptide protein n=1 Tax=Puccinia sorghi TaxID=27349 RepID=A0A0L6VQU1_9BASI|nr:putative signal peptide protein [Puccinia sorghi]